MDIVVREESNVKKFLVGRFDLLLMSEASLNGYLKKNGKLGQKSEFVKVFTLMKDREYLGFSYQTSPKYIDMFRNAFNKIKRDDRYQKIKSKYYP